MASAAAWRRRRDLNPRAYLWAKRFRAWPVFCVSAGTRERPLQRFLHYADVRTSCASGFGRGSHANEMKKSRPKESSAQNNGCGKKRRIPCGLSAPIGVPYVIYGVINEYELVGYRKKDFADIMIFVVSPK